VLLGNEHPSIAPYAPYPAADGDVLVAVGTERQWRELCAAMEATELGDDPRFSDNARRVANRAALRTELEARFATKTIAEWLGRFEAANVPCAPVNTVAAAFAQEQIAMGDLVQDVTLASGTTIKMVGSPLVLDGHHLPIRRRPPLLGEHTDEIAHPEGAER
jgi:crotonobetainyl-CoA:carnitine CoA-transferase CaiB-like acyl-CoA transferase